MKFKEFQDEVRGIIVDSCAALGFKDVQVDVGLPPSPDYGDLASAVPIRLAKLTGKKPAEVAVQLASEAMKLAKNSKYAGTISPHRGGYLNFSLNLPPFFVDAVESVRQGEMGAKPHKGESVIVEHTNVNPNKALHIGHARNLVLGDSLVKVLRHLGKRVQAVNYIDDSGAQVADVIVGFKFMGISDTPPPGVKFDVYCGDQVYTKVTEEYVRNPSLKEKQSTVLKEIERGKGEMAEYVSATVRKIVSAQLETCWRLGASYDLLNWESQLVHSGMWESVFETLKQGGHVKLETQGDNKGCWVIPDPDTGEQKVVVRSDGTVVYVAKDMPYAAWKIGLIGDPFGYDQYGPQPDGKMLYTTNLSGKKGDLAFGGADLAVSVIDTRQSYLQKIVARVLDMVKSGSSKRYLHRSYEVVALSKSTALELGFEVQGEFAHMSGRKGLFVNVDSVMERLTERAKRETRKRNLSEPDEWIAEVAEAVSVAALRYDLLKQDPDKIIVFDAVNSLKFQGDTGPYLLYTYARARRILDKTEGKPAIDLKAAAKLTNPKEASLVKKLSMLDLAVEKAGEYMSPKEIALYAHDLAVAFNEFYEGVPVNQEEDLELKNARLALVDAASKVLAESMGLIGIRPLPKI